MVIARHRVRAACGLRARMQAKKGEQVTKVECGQLRMRHMTFGDAPIKLMYLVLGRSESVAKQPRRNVLYIELSTVTGNALVRLTLAESIIASDELIT